MADTQLEAQNKDFGAVIQKDLTRGLVWFLGCGTS